MPKDRPIELTGVGRILLTTLISEPSARWQRYLPPLAWAGFIFFLSSMPGSAYPEIKFPFADKVVHASLYLPLGYWLARAVCFERKGNGHWRLIAYLVLAAYGLSDEFHQRFVPQRTFSLGDWAVDCVAGAVGLALWHLGQTWRDRIRNFIEPKRVVKSKQT